MTPLLISIQWLLDKLGLPGWGFIARNYYRVLLPAAAHSRARGRRAGARPRRAVRLQSRVLGRHRGDRLGERRSPSSPSARCAKWPLVGITADMQRTVFVDRTRRQQTGDAIAEIVKRLAGRHLGGAVRGRHVERRQSRAAVPLGAGRRGEGRRRARRTWRQAEDPADVDRLHRPARHPDGPPASAAGRLVRRSRLHAAHQGVHRARRGRRRGQLRRAGCGRWRRRPQGDGEIAGRRGAGARLLRRCAAGRARRMPPRLKSVTKSKIWIAGQTGTAG